MSILNWKKSYNALPRRFYFKGTSLYFIISCNCILLKEYAIYLFLHVVAFYWIYKLKKIFIWKVTYLCIHIYQREIRLLSNKMSIYMFFFSSWIKDAWIFIIEIFMGSMLWAALSLQNSTKICGAHLIFLCFHVHKFLLSIVLVKSIKFFL